MSWMILSIYHSHQNPHVKDSIFILLLLELSFTKWILGYETVSPYWGFYGCKRDNNLSHPASPLLSLSPPSHFGLPIPYSYAFLPLPLSFFPFPYSPPIPLLTLFFSLLHLLLPSAFPHLVPALCPSLSKSSIFMWGNKMKQSVPMVFHNSLTISASGQHLWKS